MKLSEIKKCAKCGKGVMHTGLPLFWRVRIERFGIDKAAVDRRAGLETFFGGGRGGAALAGVMGLDEDIAHPVTEEKVLILCEDCAVGRLHCGVAQLAELEPGTEAVEQPLPAGPPFKQGMELIQVGQCLKHQTSAIACWGCTTGHALECHHPNLCEEANCTHYQAQKQKNRIVAVVEIIEPSKEGQREKK